MLFLVFFIFLWLFIYLKLSQNWITFIYASKEALYKKKQEQDRFQWKQGTSLLLIYYFSKLIKRIVAHYAFLIIDDKTCSLIWMTYCFIHDEKVI